MNARLWDNVDGANDKECMDCYNSASLLTHAGTFFYLSPRSVR